MPGLDHFSEANATQQNALHERHCSGMSFAKRIIGQSADAALKLSKHQEVLEWYKQYGKSKSFTFGGQDFAKEVEDKINKIFENAKRHFEIG